MARAALEVLRQTLAMAILLKGFVEDAHDSLLFEKRFRITNFDF